MTTSQLTPKLQFCLSDAGFAPRISQSGKVSHRFAIVTDERQLFVEPVGAAVVISAWHPATGAQTEQHYIASDLENYSEEALTLMFETLATFA